MRSHKCALLPPLYSAGASAFARGKAAPAALKWSRLKRRSVCAGWMPEGACGRLLTCELQRLESATFYLAGAAAALLTRRQGEKAQWERCKHDQLALLERALERDSQVRPCALPELLTCIWFAEWPAGCTNWLAGRPSDELSVAAN